MLSSLFPPISSKQTSALKKAHVHESMTNGKKKASNPYPPRVKASIRSPRFHLNREPPISRLCCTALAVAFPFSLMNPTLCIGLASQVSQLPHEPVLCPVKARTLYTDPEHFTLADNTLRHSIPA
jgi:hypothetical protein